MDKQELEERIKFVMASLFTDTDWVVDSPEMEAMMDIVEVARKSFK